MRRLSFSLIVLCCLCLSNAFAGMSRPIDLDAEPEAWQGTIIAVVQPTAKAPVPAGYDVIREVIVERVLYGPGSKNRPGGQLAGNTIPITSYYERAHITHPEIKLEVGKHYILVMSIGPGTLIYGEREKNLGPLHNVMPVADEHDQAIDDIQKIIDSASCQSTDVKTQRLQEMEVKEIGRPLVAQYVMQARVNLARAAVTNAENLCWKMLYIGGIPSKNDPATLILADRLLISLDSSASWSTSPDRRKLFTNLLAQMKKDDPDYQYVQEVVKSTVNTPPAK